MSTIKLRETKSPFSGMCGYLSELHNLALVPAEQKDWMSRCIESLDGEVTRELRKVISIDMQRKFGVFFTGNTLGQRLLNQCGDIDRYSTIYDPSCGMGDLLLSAAKCLPLGITLTETIKIWGFQISGTDLHSEFVEGAKARLIILARLRHGDSKLINNELDSCFPNIRVADGLNEVNAYENSSLIMMNPPFGINRITKDCEWAGGQITESARFVISALERIKPGTQILAILPDVLRSGSFTQKWRNKVSELAEVNTVESYGKFNETADVDVFILKATRRQINTNIYNWNLPKFNHEDSKTVSDFFEVHVGKIVPHRDKNEGTLHPYIHPRCVPTWTVMVKYTETWRHYGCTFDPPFVAIRRTSRPGDLYRATATVIGGNKPIAVENHLIVCEPKDKKARDMFEFDATLKDRTS